MEFLLRWLSPVEKSDPVRRLEAHRELLRSHLKQEREALSSLRREYEVLKRSSMRQLLRLEHVGEIAVLAAVAAVADCKLTAQRLQQVMCACRCTLLECEDAYVGSLLQAAAAAVPPGPAPPSSSGRGGGLADSEGRGRADSADSSISGLTFPLVPPVSSPMAPPSTPRLRTRSVVGAATPPSHAHGTPSRRGMSSSASVAGPEALSLPPRAAPTPAEVHAAAEAALRRTYDDWVAPSATVTAIVGVEMGKVEAFRLSLQESPLYQHALRMCSEDAPTWPALQAGYPTPLLLNASTLALVDIVRSGATAASVKAARGGMYRTWLREHMSDNLAYAAAEQTVMSILGFKHTYHHRRMSGGVPRSGAGWREGVPSTGVGEAGGGGVGDGAGMGGGGRSSPLDDGNTDGGTGGDDRSNKRASAHAAHTTSLLHRHRHPAASHIHEVLMHAVDDQLPWQLEEWGVPLDTWREDGGDRMAEPHAGGTPSSPPIWHTYQRLSLLLGVEEVGHSVLASGGVDTAPAAPSQGHTAVAGASSTCDGRSSLADAATATSLTVGEGDSHDGTHSSSSSSTPARVSSSMDTPRLGGGGTGATATVHGPIVVHESHYQHVPSPATASPKVDEPMELTATAGVDGDGLLEVTAARHTPPATLGDDGGGEGASPRPAHPDQAPSDVMAVEEGVAVPCATTMDPAGSEEDALLVLLALFTVGAPRPPALVRAMLTQILCEVPDEERAACHDRLWGDLRRLRTCLGEMYRVVTQRRHRVSDLGKALLHRSTPEGAVLHHTLCTWLLEGPRARAHTVVHHLYDPLLRLDRPDAALYRLLTSQGIPISNDACIIAGFPPYCATVVLPPNAAAGALPPAVMTVVAGGGNGGGAEWARLASNAVALAAASVSEAHKAGLLAAGVSLVSPTPPVASPAMPSRPGMPALGPAAVTSSVRHGGSFPAASPPAMRAVSMVEGGGTGGGPTASPAASAGGGDGRALAAGRSISTASASTGTAALGAGGAPPYRPLVTVITPRVSRSDSVATMPPALTRAGAHDAGGGPSSVLVKSSQRMPRLSSAASVSGASVAPSVVMPASVIGMGAGAARPRPQLPSPMSVRNDPGVRAREPSALEVRNGAAALMKVLVTEYGLVQPGEGGAQGSTPPGRTMVGGDAAGGGGSGQSERDVLHELIMCVMSELLMDVYGHGVEWINLPPSLIPPGAASTPTSTTPTPAPTTTTTVLGNEFGVVITTSSGGDAFAMDGGAGGAVPGVRWNPRVNREKGPRSSAAAELDRRFSELKAECRWHTLEPTVFIRDVAVLTPTAMERRMAGMAPDPKTAAMAMPTPFTIPRVLLELAAYCPDVPHIVWLMDTSRAALEAEVQGRLQAAAGERGGDVVPAADELVPASYFTMSRVEWPHVHALHALLRVYGTVLLEEGGLQGASEYSLALLLGAVTYLPSIVMDHKAALASGSGPPTSGGGKADHEVGVDGSVSASTAGESLAEDDRAPVVQLDKDKVAVAQEVTGSAAALMHRAGDTMAAVSQRTMLTTEDLDRAVSDIESTLARLSLAADHLRAMVHTELTAQEKAQDFAVASETFQHHVAVAERWAWREPSRMLPTTARSVRERDGGGFRSPPSHLGASPLATFFSGPSPLRASPPHPPPSSAPRSAPIPIAAMAGGGASGFGTPGGDSMLDLGGSSLRTRRGVGAMALPSTPLATDRTVGPASFSFSAFVQGSV